MAVTAPVIGFTHPLAGSNGTFSPDVSAMLSRSHFCYTDWNGSPLRDSWRPCSGGAVPRRTEIIWREIQRRIKGLRESDKVKIIEERRLQPNLVPSYQFVYSARGEFYNDDEQRSRCDDQHEEALRTRYRLESLPINSALPRHAEKCAVVRSAALAREIGVENLWLAFSGYWPRALDMLIGTR